MGFLTKLCLYFLALEVHVCAGLSSFERHNEDLLDIVENNDSVKAVSLE
jgi:hypothetical protein